MDRVAIYCRLSEEDRDKLNKTDDSESIKNQKSMLLQYAMQQGWEIYNIYSDDDYSGADRKRPEFNRLLHDAEERKFDIVLCKAQSRFTRELELVEKYIHGLFPRWGIRFVSLTDNADTDDENNKKSRQIHALMNEWYLEDMSRNIKSTFNTKRENGYHIGAFALYGYKKDPDEKGHLIVDEEAAEVVREVFSLFLQGMGKTAIAKRLNDRGIPNPTEYKCLNGLRYKQPDSKNSTLWKYSAISDMLTNEMYIGNMVQGKYGSISFKTKENKPRPKDQWYKVEGTHEPIIDRETWDRVQLMIKGRAKPFETGNIGIFASKVHCSCCGYKMRSSKSRGEHYLQCATKHVAKGACEGAFISVKTLEGIVIDELNRMTREFLDKDELQQRIEFLNDLTERKKKLEADIQKYKNLLDKSANGLAQSYIDKNNGELDIATYNIIVKQFKEDQQKYEKVIADGEMQIVELDERLAAGDNRRELIERYTNITKLNRETVDIMIDKIVVGRRIKGTKNYPVEIYWNF